MSSINFPALTGIRAVAAYMVYIHHFNPFLKTTYDGKLHNFFQEFHIGVTIFFVLSGFLIANRYYDESNFNFKSYLIKRFSRIYPMYFILTTITFFIAFLYSENPASIRSYFLNITFLRGFFDDFKFSGIPQGWTLTVEEVFYLLAPFFFILTKKSKWTLILIPVFFALLGLLLVYIFQHIDFYGFMANNNFMFVYTFFGRASEFFVGIALALFIRRKKDIKIKNLTSYAILCIILCVYLISISRVGKLSGIETIQGKMINTLFLPLFGIAPLFYALINENTFLSKILSTKTALLLGKSSYVFYLIHMGVFKSGLSIISTNYIFLFILLNVLAVILYLFVEKPLNDSIRKVVKN